MKIRLVRDRRNRMITAGLLLLSVFVGPVVMMSPASASAHVSCYGDYCSGKDPMATGCANDAITTASADLGWGELDLRWSPTCKTNWARIYVYPRKALGGGYVAAVQSTGYRQVGNIGAFVGIHAQTETDWSPMIYSPTKCVKAGAVLGVGYIWDYDWTACR